MRKKGKKMTALMLAVVMILSLCTGFTYKNGFGDVYFESEQEIFDGVTYSEIIGNHPGNGIEHAYVVTADIEESSLIPLVFNGEVRGSYTVGSMVKYAEEQGYKVVAAINGDIYDMASGTPKSTVIHEYNIVTSGYDPDRVITFDSAGRASMKSAKLTYSMAGTINEIVEVLSETMENTDQSEDTVASETADTASNTATVQQVTESRAWSGNAAYFNVVQGNSNEITIYNRHYSSSTKTSGSRVEVVIDCSEYGDIQLRVDKTLEGRVQSVNVGTCNTSIGDNQLVLSVSSASPYASQLAALAVGSEFEITVTDEDDCGLADAKEAVGLYYSIVENGQIVTSGTGINPRTILGIKDDGSIVLYVVDGRQSSVSKGLSLVDAAKHMIELGCNDAFNLDGGGSSTIYARFAGIDSSAVLKNSPSENAQRKVANGIILAYRDKGSSSAEQLNLYPALSLVMPGGTVQINTYASNSLYEKTSVPSNIYYDATMGSIDDNGLFTAGTRTGTAQITASSGRISGSTSVEITDDITFTPSVTKLTLDAGQSSDINITAKYGTVKVNSSDNLFDWSCDEAIGTIDENGVFTAVSKSVGGITGNIYVSYEGKTVTIPVTIGEAIVDFSDTKDHWARKYIGALAGRGIVDGMGGGRFEPDGTLTRAQFLAMLAKSLYDVDVTKAQVSGFSDVLESEWYYNYVNWGFENGIVKGVSETNFEPGSKITREQMAVMLCNFAKYLEMSIPQTTAVPQFSDNTAISDWSLDYVRTVVGGGIMNGMTDGSFEPQGTATRAQAAKVIYVFSNIKDGIE